jgi:hypothetical protein
MQREVGPGISSGAYRFIETNHKKLVTLSSSMLEFRKMKFTFLIIHGLARTIIAQDATD